MVEPGWTERHKLIVSPAEADTDLKLYPFAFGKDFGAVLRIG